MGKVASDLDRLERKTPHGVAGDQGMRFVLTQAQLEGLKTHVYRSQGVSLIESLVLKRLWRWLVSLLPSSLAPNLITFAGFVIAMATSLAVILPDLNAEGKVRRERGGLTIVSPLGSSVDVPLLCSWALYLPDVGWHGRHPGSEDWALHSLGRVL